MPFLETREPRLDLLLARGWQLEPDLEAAPHGAIEQLRVVGRGNRDDVAGQRVDLEQQRTHDPLDLARLVEVSPLLADGVELVEEQDAAARSSVLEQLCDALRRLTQVAAYDRLVPHEEHWNVQGMSDRLRQRGLSVSGWARKENPVARLQIVGPQQVGATLFGHQLTNDLLHLGGEDEILDASRRHDLGY